MVVFFVKRLLTSLLVVLISTVDHVRPGRHLDRPARRTSAPAPRPNKAEQIANRIAELQPRQPVLSRYFSWLKGASGCLYGNCDLGENWQTNQHVTSLLSGAVTTTIQLVGGGHAAGDRARRDRRHRQRPAPVHRLRLLDHLPLLPALLAARLLGRGAGQGVPGHRLQRLPRRRIHDLRRRRSWSSALVVGVSVSSAVAGKVDTRLRNFAHRRRRRGAPAVVYLNVTDWLQGARARHRR